jgi:hypothetical protein
VDGLSEEQIQVLAKTSYAYWALEQRTDGEGLPNDAARKVVTKVARWHLEYIGGNTNKASKRLQEACELRKQHQLDTFRICFDDKFSETLIEMRNDITSDLEKQLVAMRGQDKEGRAVLFKLPRVQGGTTEQAYLRTQLFVAERSAAVTEYVTRGKHDQITAIFSMHGQNSRCAPPLSWQISVIGVLQKLYPGRVGTLILLDPPFLIRQAYAALRPFLSESIKKGTQVVSGAKHRGKVLNELLEEENTFSPEGELTKSINVQEYLNDVPFYCPYDYKP